ncbi:MAG: response regulator [Leptolyngbyaceae cyanobacterium bins.349]|nr:response regulator [Leptolyngbyaceae cyanobacterium bins.349]
MSKCILIVDDEADVLSVTRMGLEMSSGWQVLTAISGQEAVAIATEHQPDVILLDWMMPEMDGRATLQALRANSTTRHIPVILVTAKAQSPDGDTFAGVDVVAVFAKPLRPLKLAELIERALQA